MAALSFDTTPASAYRAWRYAKRCSVHEEKADELVEPGPLSSKWSALPSPWAAPRWQERAATSGGSSLPSSWSRSLVRRAAQRPAELVEHPAHALSLVGRQLPREGGRYDGCQPSAHVDAATFRPRSSRRGRRASAGGSTRVARVGPKFRENAAEIQVPACPPRRPRP